MQRIETRRTPWQGITAVVAMIGVVSLTLTGCADSSPNDTPSPTTNQAAPTNGQTVQYTCSMHPEIVQDKPGDCPKCGMKLVEKR